MRTIAACYTALLFLVAGCAGPIKSLYPPAPGAPTRSVYLINQGTWHTGITLSEPGFERLCKYIGDTHVLDEQGRPITLGDDWYRARGKYCVFNTCNTWVASGLRAAGCPITSLLHHPRAAALSNEEIWPCLRAPTTSTNNKNLPLSHSP